MPQAHATECSAAQNACGAMGFSERAGESPLREERASIELVSDLPGIRDLAGDYERLYQVTGNTLPFATHEWHLAWCEHLLSCSPRATQQPLFCVVRNSRGTCVAIVPLIL